MNNNFTPRVQLTLSIARREADRFKHNYIGAEHILLGLLRLGQGMAVSILENNGINLQEMISQIEQSLRPGDAGSTGNGTLPYTPRVRRMLTAAGEEAGMMKHSYVGTEHLLLAMLRDADGLASSALHSSGITYEIVRKGVMQLIDPKLEGNRPEQPDSRQSNDRYPKDDDDDEFEELLHSQSFTHRNGTDEENRTPALRAFGCDLTARARAGELDPVIGRAKETERVMQILCRRTKNNPILLGEAGVGKTAIVEGLAQMIVQGDVPEFLIGRRIISLDLAQMVAGTKYRGQFEERIKAVMAEILNEKNVILFIDEMHNLIGAGSSEGTPLDASNIIKPALARGELQIIGASTIKEYRMHIEKDAAFDRRFQQVQVGEPTVEETVRILRGIAPKYEAHHRVHYTENALSAAAYFTKRYINGRFLPDKAIDVMDEAGSLLCLSRMTRPADIKESQRKGQELAEAKKKAVAEQDYEKAARIRDELAALTDSVQEKLDRWKESMESSYINVDAEEIMAVISKWTGIPLERMERKEAERLLNMESELKSKVIGQDAACSAISRALRRSRTDIKDPRRPIGSFLFMGSTGVGKTYLARNLAEIMFGTADALIQIDMSEYMDSFSTSRLIGAPPGYVGHEEGGQLTEQVRRRPYAVILFDEVEKAHPDVMNLLLQILEEGTLTDAMGRKANFRNTIIILTSNIGASLANRQGKMGFGAAAADEADYDTMKERITEAAKKHFRPEFINRFDELVVFRMLERRDLEQIVVPEAKKLTDRLAERRITLQLSPEVIGMLVDRGYDPQYGARPMRRAIERLLEDPIAEAILRGELTEGHTSLAKKNLAGDGIVFEDITPAPEPETTEQPKPAKPRTRRAAAEPKAVKKSASPRRKKSAE